VFVALVVGRLDMKLPGPVHVYVTFWVALFEVMVVEEDPQVMMPPEAVTPVGTTKSPATSAEAVDVHPFGADTVRM